MSGNVTRAEGFTGVMGDCRRRLGCKHIGTEIFENAYHKAYCLKYSRQKGMGKPNCIVFDGARCPWFEWDEKTKLPKKKRSKCLAPIQFHQIFGPKTRVLLAEILLHQYDRCHPGLDVAFRSLMADEVTAKRLASVIFERFDVLDATIYEPVFESLTMSCFGPVLDYDELRVYRFNDSFLTLVKSFEQEQFEAMIKDLTESVDSKLRDEIDIRFEAID